MELTRKGKVCLSTVKPTPTGPCYTKSGEWSQRRKEYCFERSETYVHRAYLVRGYPQNHMNCTSNRRTTMRTITSCVQTQKEDWYSHRLVPMGMMHGTRRTINKTRAHTKHAVRLSLVMAGFNDLVFI